MVETVETKPTLRRRIIEAADALIREQGLGGATTREIAKAAGCAEGSIYVHFEDKIDLVIAVIVEREPFFAELLELPAKAGENAVEDNLVPWVEELLQLAARQPADLLRAHGRPQRLRALQGAPARAGDRARRRLQSGRRATCAPSRSSGGSTRACRPTSSPRS